MIGIPYAMADVDEDGYFVVCPACSMVCRPSTRYRSEDAQTKGAGRVYARHWRSEHGDTGLHRCQDHAEPYTSDTGALGHGWVCGVCGFLLQVG